MQRIRLVLAGLVFAVAGCDAVTLWSLPNPTCTDWQHMADDGRSTQAERVIRDGSLFEGVRVAQHAPAGTDDAQLVLMATSSITKNCELQAWSPTVLVKDIVLDLYAAPVGLR